MPAVASSGVSSAVVTTPWYPSPHNRMLGSFVADHARVTARLADRVSIVHAEEWPGGPPKACDRLQPAFDAVLGEAGMRGAFPRAGAIGALYRVPVLTVGGSSIVERAEGLVRDVRGALGPELDGELVHGHVGYLGGLVAVRLAAAGTRVLVTEHSTGLGDVLATPEGRGLYAEVLDRSEALLCVSGLLRDLVIDALPDFKHKVEVLPNPVDFGRITARSTPPTALVRWLFVGGLIPRKGVVRLMTAFIAVARDDPRPTLTMIGDGPLRSELEAMATNAGVRGRVEFLSSVRHAELLRRLREFDLLMAPSTYETFHLAVLEAIAAGLPVIVTRSGGPEETLAGLEQLVGRIIDVGETADELVDAFKDLQNSLDRLDLRRARGELAARFGPSAVLRQLAARYGCSVPIGEPPSPDPPSDEAPSSITVLAVSGWRRYASRLEIEAAKRLGVPAMVVTADREMANVAAPLPVIQPGAFGARSSRSLPLRRRVATAWRRVRDIAEARRQSRRIARSTIVVTDMQSMPLAAELLERHPRARLCFEISRSGMLAPPADAEERT